MPTETQSTPVQPGLQKNALPANRQQSLTVVKGVEEKVRPGPWKTRTSYAFFGGAVLWLLIQCVLLNMVEVLPVPVTSANLEGEMVDGPAAGAPMQNVLEDITALADQAPGPELLAHPMLWVAVSGLLYLVFLLTERTKSGLAGKVLDEVPYALKIEQEKFFSRPVHSEAQIPLEAGKVDEDQDNFAEDLPTHVKKHLAWWNAPEMPDAAELETALAELKNFLGEEAYLWLRACAIWPEPQWHLALYMGRGLRNAGGESLHSFESADRLASLPWFMTGSMPLWLRRHFLGTLPKEQQQQIRYLVQALLISTARGTKTDFALELAEYHTLFMKSAGNETTDVILKDLPTRSPLREDLFTQFMQKPLDAAFYKTLKNRNEDGKTPKLERSHFSTSILWLGRTAWVLNGLVLLAILILLPLLANYGGFTVDTRHAQGVAEYNSVKKAVPATFWWMVATGPQVVTITSKDYEPVTLTISVKPRTISDLGPIVMRHQRTGFAAPQPGDL